ncbi:MAG: hypothetical protein EPO06_07995 [Burkholderiaceae bacterium]|nr:MAG: hypothetical protein EPO06_07995 [Burkholderiaceae bacterium]
MHHKLAHPTDYSYTIEHGVVCVVDHAPVRCVTDDVENIIAHLKRVNVDLTAAPLIYRNTLGIWHQIAIKDGQFDGFWAIGERNKAVAIGTVYPGFELAASIVDLMEEDMPAVHYLGESVTS